MKSRWFSRALLHVPFMVGASVLVTALATEPAQAGPIKDGICAAVTITSSILPAIISLAAVAGAAVAMYFKVGGEWIQGALKGVLAAGLLASVAAIGGYMAGANAAQFFNCAGGAGAMQQIIQNL